MFYQRKTKAFKPRLRLGLVRAIVDRQWGFVDGRFFAKDRFHFGHFLTDLRKKRNQKLINYRRRWDLIAEQKKPNTGIQDLFYSFISGPCPEEKKKKSKPCGAWC